MCAHADRRKWRFTNALLLLAATLIILHTTLLSRTPGTYTAVLTPFAALAAARQQPELYREMLMNVFLFFPLGLTMSNALPRKWHRWLRIALTALTSCVLSAGIEYAQYRFALGMAETDDVICNTLGAFVGASSLLLAHAMEKHKERPTTMTLTATETQFLHIAKTAVSGGELPTEAVDWPAGKPAEAAAHPLRGRPQDACRRGERPAVRGHQAAGHRAGAEPDRALGGVHRPLPQAPGRRAAPCCGEGTALQQALSPARSPYQRGRRPFHPGGPLYIELHRHLFDSAEDAHDELNHFFVDIAPVEVDGFLTMPPHEHLLYLILHAYKHFVYSGIGLRQFCDIGLWARAYHDQIDWQRLHDQCASVHAATFAAAAFRIARTYLDIDFDLPGLWVGDVDVEPLLHDTLCGGVYGSNSYTRLHSSTVTLNAVKASRTGEKSSVLRTVFPKRAYLERRYPYLKKRPYLLPVAWVQRIAHYAGEKQSGADNSASGSIKLAKGRIELMKRYGIIDEKK